MTDTLTTEPQPVDVFVQMSALLTGFAAQAIAPSLDPVDLRRTLFDTARQGAGAAFDHLLAQYSELSGGQPVEDMSAETRQEIGNQLLGLGGCEQPQDLVETARSVMRLWYLGSWYPIDGSDPGGAVAGDQAYIRGLAWKVMQSHAMGYSTWQYGYWKNPPPPLTDFTGRPEPAPASVAAARRKAQAAPEAAAGAPMLRLRPADGPVNATGQGRGGQSPASLVSGDELTAEGGAS